MHCPAKYLESCPTKVENRDLIRIFVDKMAWSTNENVLEFGCGPGSRGYHYILPRIEQFDSILYAVDISQSMIDYAVEHYPHKRIISACGDILDSSFPFPEVKFDKIVSTYALHFINNVRNALKNLNEITKVGGQAGFIFDTSNCFHHQALPILAQSPTWSPFMKEYENFTISWSKFEPGEQQMGFTNLFESCGWKVQQLEFLPMHINKPLDTFLDFCLSVNLFLNKIPDSMHAELNHDLKTIICKIAKIPVDSKHIDAYFENMMIIVTK